MRATTVITTGLCAVLATGAVAVASTGAQRADRAAQISPANFTHPRANPYFPLTPGLVTTLRGTDSGTHFKERVTITHNTKMILGVRATVIRDVLNRADGSLAEKTHDWYADDNMGNVWYLGEQTATYKPNGQLESREGSWQAGVNGAVAGLIMPRNPRPTLAYRQEYLKGQAEDQAWIVQNNTTTTTPRATYHHAVRSFEWSRLEPRVVSVKFYARGLGIVRERDLSGGTEKFELVGVTRP